MGSIQNRYYRGFTSNSSKAFVLHSGKAVLCWSSLIPYQQGSLFRPFRAVHTSLLGSVLIPYFTPSSKQCFSERLRKSVQTNASYLFSGQDRLNPLSAGKSVQTVRDFHQDNLIKVLIPYQQGSLFRPNRCAHGSRSEVLIPYQQGSLFRLCVNLVILQNVRS